MTLYLKKLNSKKNVGKNYLKWMNDFKVHKYTEQKNLKHTLNSLRKFVNKCNNSYDTFLYGIFLEKKHIGNIKLGPIIYNHKSAEISYFIGEKKMWNKGYATKAISLIIKIAKKKGLKKLTAGFYDKNFGSKRVLLKNNFKKEAHFKSQIQYKSKRHDKIVFGKIIK